MKLYANIKEESGRDVLRIISLTKRMPKGNNIFTVYIDEHMKGNAKRREAVQQVHQLTGRAVVDMFAGYASGHIRIRT